MAVYLGDKIIYSGGGSGGLTVDLPADITQGYETVTNNPARPLYSDWGTLQGEVDSCINQYSSENFFVNILQALNLWQQDMNFASAYGFIVANDCDSITFSIGDYYVTSTGVGGAKRTVNEDGTISVKTEATLTNVKAGTRIITAYQDIEQFDIKTLKFPTNVSYYYFNCNLVYNENMFTYGSFISSYSDLRGFEIAEGKNIIFDSSTDYSTKTFTIFTNFPRLESLPKKLDLSGFTGTINFANDCHILKQLPEVLNIPNICGIDGFLKNSGCPENFPYTLNLSGLTKCNDILYNTKGIKRLTHPITISANCNIVNLLRNTVGIDTIEKISLTLNNTVNGSNTTNYTLNNCLDSLQAQEIKELAIKSNVTTSTFEGLKDGYIICQKIGTFTAEAEHLGSCLTRLPRCLKIDKVILNTKNSTSTQYVALPSVEFGDIGEVEITSEGDLYFTLGKIGNATAKYNNIDSITLTASGDIVSNDKINQITTLKSLTATTTNGKCDLNYGAKNVSNMTINATGDCNIGTNTMTFGNVSVTTSGKVGGGGSAYKCGNVNISCGSVDGLLSSGTLVSVGDISITSTGDIKAVLKNTGQLIKAGTITVTSGTLINELISASKVFEMGEVILTAPSVVSSLYNLRGLQSLKVTINANTKISSVLYITEKVLFMEDLDITATALSLAENGNIGFNCSAKNLNINLHVESTACKIDVFDGDLTTMLNVTGQIKIKAKGDCKIFTGTQRLENFNCDLDIDIVGQLGLFYGTSNSPELNKLKTLNLGNKIKATGGLRIGNPYSIVTLNGDFSNLTANDQYNTFFDKMYNLVNANVILSSTASIDCFKDSTLLSLASLNYIANNAPTLTTSKAIAFSKAVYDQNADWYSTLVSKGWTVNKTN